MRALLVTQHYPPEVTAGAFRLQSFADALGEDGHDVTVLTAVPNHPLGVIEPGFRGRAVVREQVSGVRTNRVWVFTRPRKTVATRLAGYASFAALAGATGVLERRPDVILASSPPLSVGPVGVALAARFGAPLALDVRDLWPESAIALGELPDGRAARVAARLEAWLYRRADAIITANDAFRRDIAARISDPGKLVVVPNGTTRVWLDAGTVQTDRARLGADNEFVWSYAGNIGLAHGLETAVEAEGLLGQGFRLRIIGHGPQRDAVERAAAALPTGRVELLGLMPPAEAARHLRAADALLVSEQQPKTVSAKLYDYCALGRPIIAATTGEMARVIQERDLALVVPPGAPTELAAAVRRLRDDDSLATALAGRARTFAEENTRSAHADRLASLLEELAEPGPGRASKKPAAGSKSPNRGR